MLKSMHKHSHKIRGHTRMDGRAARERLESLVAPCIPESLPAGGRAAGFEYFDDLYSLPRSDWGAMPVGL